jgi:hypothetical protein
MATMKLFAVAVFSVFMTGCSFILPIPHDGALFDNLVQVKVAIDKTNCQDKNWNVLFGKIEQLKVYASLRKDPQAKAIEDLESALKKANESGNEKFCESVLKINRVRVDTVVDAWRGR